MSLHKVPVDIWCEDDDLMPIRGTDGSSGWDLRASEDVTIGARGIVMVRTGVRIQMPWGWEAQVRSRSGMSLNGMTVANSPGTIDNDYTGEICVILHNHLDIDYVVSRGDKIAQMTFQEVPAIDFIRRHGDGPTETERGAGGFGSTGT